MRNAIIWLGLYEDNGITILDFITKNYKLYGRNQMKSNVLYEVSLEL